MASSSISTGALADSLQPLNKLNMGPDRFSVLTNIDNKGILTSIQDHFCSLHLFSLEELVELTQRIISSSYHTQEFLDEIWRQILKGDLWRGEINTIMMDGSSSWVKTCIVPLVKFDKPREYIVFYTDISEQKDTEEELQSALKDLKDLKYALDESSIVAITDEKGIMKYINRKFCEVSKYSIQELIGKTHRIINSGYHSEEFFREMWQTISSGKTWHGEIRNKTKDGRYYWVQTSIIPFLKEGKPYRYVSIRTEITERKQMEERIMYMAFHDGLTGLPNRLQFQKCLSEAITTARLKNKSHCVMFIDLDRFKFINDSLGHNTGDLLLKMISERLLNCVRDKDIISRHGGDEFIVLLSDTGKEIATSIAQRILEQFAQPFLLNENELSVTPSIGLSVYPYDGEGIEDLIKSADLALYKAKEEGRNRFKWFNSTMKDVLKRKMNLEDKLRKAVDNKDFVIQYQPMINLKTNQIVCVEALIRWQDEEKGIIPPDEFIPLAEETGLIIPIGQWVLEEACKQNKRWQDSRMTVKPIKVSVNISTRQFQQPNFVSCVEHILKTTGLNPQYLELEITESIALNDTSFTIQKLKALKKLGVKISIDDFGTGFSSLSYLRNFPIDKLKIDKSFMENVLEDPKNKAIVKAIITLSQNLDLKVIAEGVENEQELNFLREQNCDQAQGYFFSKPLDVHVAEKFFKNFFHEKHI